MKNRHDENLRRVDEYRSKRATAQRAKVYPMAMNSENREGWRKTAMERRKRRRQHDVERTAELRAIQKLRAQATEARLADEAQHQLELIRASILLRPARDEVMNRCG